MRKIKDQRLFPVPALRQSGSCIVIKAKALTPLALSTVHSLFLAPLESVWRFLVAMLVLDLGFYLCAGLTVFSQIPYQRSDVYTVMAVLWVYWFIERIARYPTVRLLFAKHIHIEIHQKYVVIGRFLFRRCYERTAQTAFSLTSSEGARESIAYQHAHSFSLVCDATKRIPLAEFCDPLEATRIVSNANAALIISDERFQYDIDPNS